MNKIKYYITLMSVSIVGLGATDIDLFIGEPNVDNFPKICFTIAASDQQGAIILESGMVSVYEDTLLNQSARLTSIADREESVSIMIAVDASRSMAGEPIDSIKAAIVEFLNQKSSGDYVGLLSFHDDVDIVCDFTTNVDTLIKHTESIEAIGGSTELNYGIVQGLKQLHENNSVPQNKALIVLSDGKDEGTAYTIDKAISQALEYNIPVYSIGYHTKSKKKYLRVLDRISEETGGQYNDAPTTKELNRIYSQVFSQIQDQSVICFTTETFAADSLEHTFGVRVELEDGREVRTEVVFRSPPAGSKIPAISWLIVIGLAGILIYVWYTSSQRAEKAKKEKDQLLGDKDRLAKELEEERAREKGSQSLSESVDDDEEDDLRSTQISRPGEASGYQPKFYFETGPLAGQTLSIEDGTSIGRAQTNNIIVSDNTVSGSHCKIGLAGGSYTIIDQGSTNGTIVNGQKVSTCAIKQGDKIQLGKVDIIVR